jgi:DNA-binding response OmpR family regulator
MDVLIVDDDKDLCIILRLICHSRDFTVSCVHTLKDALEEIYSVPMLMFLDNNLPDGLGLEMIEHFKSLSPLTKIVFTTGSPEDRIMKQAYWKGSDYFLAKPFLLHGIREILSQFQQYFEQPPSEHEQKIRP